MVPYFVAYKMLLFMLILVIKVTVDVYSSRIDKDDANDSVCGLRY